MERAAEHVRAAAGAVPLGLHVDQGSVQAGPPDQFRAADPAALRHAPRRAQHAADPDGGGDVLPEEVQPKPATMTPEQAQQQKMMTVDEPLLFPLMLYTGPSGLNLYILTSTAFGIIESKVIREHIKEREEAEKLGPTIIDAPPPDKRGGGGGGGGGKKAVEEEPQKGWLERLAGSGGADSQCGEEEAVEVKVRSEMDARDTIAAVSSAVGVGARMIVRASGGAHGIARRLRRSIGLRARRSSCRIWPGVWAGYTGLRGRGVIRGRIWWSFMCRGIRCWRG